MIIIFILIAASMVASAYFVLLIRSFDFMTIHELKRQARDGNLQAAKVYSARAYGLQLQMLLWTVTGLFFTTVIVLATYIIGPIWTIFISLPFFAVVLGVTPRTKRPVASLSMAAKASPIFETILRISFPVSRKLEHKLRRITMPESEPTIYSRQELLETIKHSRQRLSKVMDIQQIEALENALNFNNQLVGDYMVALDKSYFISGEESLSPVVFGEIFSSGLTRIPVYQGNNQHIIGTLFARDITKNEGKKINQVMHSDVYYINEQNTLADAYNILLETNHHLLIVVNEFEDVVGILSIEDVIKQLMKQNKKHKLPDASNIKLMSKKPEKVDTSL
jgi:CBS domain containing-hemolysin-like protein